MRKLQCTKCGQVFWTEPKQVDERLIGSGEWIQHPCPRCGGEWAAVEAVARRPKAAAPPIQEKAAFTPGRIRSLRRRLGITQKELAALIGVNRATANLWEKGKTKPKEDKMERFAGLAGMGKEEVRKVLAQRTSNSRDKKNGLRKWK